MFDMSSSQQFYHKCTLHVYCTNWPNSCAAMHQKISIRKDKCHMNQTFCCLHHFRHVRLYVGRTRNSFMISIDRWVPNCHVKFQSLVTLKISTKVGNPNATQMQEHVCILLQIANHKLVPFHTQHFGANSTWHNCTRLCKATYAMCSYKGSS
jgi:hypothetical protein